MLRAMSGEPKSQESNDTITCHQRCRIPQRLPPERQRPFPKPGSELMKNNGDVPPPRLSNFGKTNVTRPRSGETRPKSANRANEMKGLTETQIYSMPSSARPEREKLLPAQRNPAPPVHKKKFNKLNNVPVKKADRHIITVPIRQKYFTKATNKHKVMNLPDQEVINKCEDMELKRAMKDFFLDFNEEESITSKADKIMHLKSLWQEKIVQFERLKNDLNDRQHEIIEIYASLRGTKQRLTELGENANLPSTDDLQIMNVANMTPNQLLKLCAEITYQKDNNEMNKNALSIDIKKLNEIPSKLVATCEQTLSTRKEFIEWFENLKNQEKGCPKSVLSKKINEFNAENDMLSSCLKSVEGEFLKEINGFIRICCNETISLQLRNDDLICELSELNSQNTDLQKKIGNFENQKSYANKIKIEGLEQELKEEKIKRMTLKDRLSLSRAEGQVKIGEERATLLESALNQARAQTRNLERTIQQLDDQNKKIRKEFDEELIKIKESMQKNTVQLEEIVHDKETLQLEKEDLKNKLQELSNTYNESITDTKRELNKNIAELIEVEKKYNEEIENKKLLQATIESQCARLVESELRYKDILKQLQEKESALSMMSDFKNKYEQVKQELQEKCIEIDNYKDRDIIQTEELHELEQKYYNLVELKEKLHTDIQNKEEYIKELEMKQVLFKQQIQENEQKMETYEEQLLTLKTHITKLKEYFGDFENLNNLHEMVNQLKSELSDTKLKNEDLLKEIEHKKETLKSLTETIFEQEEFFKQKQVEINLLSDKQQKNQDISRLNQKIFEKNSEVEALINNVETKEEQIDQLEKIIFSLENQNRLATIQKRKDQDKIYSLEKIIKDYEYIIEQKNKLPSKDLDNLIKTLEDELGIPMEPQNMITTQYKCSDDLAKRQSFTLIGPEKVPTKIVMGNFVKKTYLTNNDNLSKIEPLGRKTAITSIKTQNEIANQSENLYSESNYKANSFCFDEINQLRNTKDKNIHYFESNLVRGGKKSKMLKLASHRIL